MKTQYYTATSVDGFIADEHNSLDWLFEVTSRSDRFAPFFAGVGAFAMGATTYEWVLEHERVRVGSGRTDLPRILECGQRPLEPRLIVPEEGEQPLTGGDFVAGLDVQVDARGVHDRVCALTGHV